MFHLRTVGKEHRELVTGSDFVDLGLASVGERTLVAPEVVVIGGDLADGVLELGRHVLLLPGVFTDVFPAAANDLSVDCQPVEGVVRLGQTSGRKES
jgi:hypothetical protein